MRARMNIKPDMMGLVQRGASINWEDSMAGWAVPEFSRNQVDKAGYALIDPNIDVESYKQSLRIINNWRAAYSYPLLNFRINLARKLRGIKTNSVIAQRIKRLRLIALSQARLNVVSSPC